MKAKLLKKLIVILCIYVLLLPMSASVLAAITPEEAAAGKTMTFGISALHESKYLKGNDTLRFGYAISGANTGGQPRIAYRIYAKDQDYTTSILCLDEMGKFPTESQSTNTYTSLGETTSETLKEIKLSDAANGGNNITQAQADKIMWLMKNAVLPEDSTETRDYKLNLIYKSLIDRNSGGNQQNPLTLDQIKEKLTEDDIIYALQAAIWSVTNPTTNVSFRGSNDGSQYQAIGEVRAPNGEALHTYIQTLYNYYITKCSGPDIIQGSNTELVAPKITPETDGNQQFDYADAGTFIYVGPFEITTSETGKSTYDYDINIKFLNGSGNVIDKSKVDYAVKFQKDGSAPGVILEKKYIEGKGEFYVAVKKNSAVKAITISLDPKAPKTSDTVVTAWATDNNNNIQPLISVNRTENPIPSSSSTIRFDVVENRNFDVALRLNISAVKRKNRSGWQIIYKDSDLKRSPTLDATPTLDEDLVFNQHAYRHQKDPVHVEIGDVVDYNITVVNESKFKTEITEVALYLPPEGLYPVNADGEAKDGSTIVESGIPSSTTNDTNGTANAMFATDPSTKVTSVTYSNPTGTDNALYEKELLPFDANWNSCYLTLELSCLVNEKAKGKVITNIAAVTGFLGREHDSDPYTRVRDDDSVSQRGEAGNLILPDVSDKTWSRYTGNSINKSDLSDSNYYYKGQEDDDDFEKIIVPGAVLDVALRKSITVVNGDVKDREREPVTTPLTDGDDDTTTSIFTDVKTPLTVHTGDKVTYTIRVFNEGNTDAYASVIEDYIPEGLGFLPFYTDNNIWVGDPGASTMRLCEIPNATNNFSDSEFSKEFVQDYTQQIVIKGNAKITTNKLANEKINAFDTSLDIKKVQITCVVIASEEELNIGDNQILRNIAAITQYKDQDGVIVPETSAKEDTDSDSDNQYELNFNPDDHQDDEDYEDLILYSQKTDESYDLALKKFITGLADGTNTPKNIPDSQQRDLHITSVESLKARADQKVAADAEYSFGLDKNSTPVQIEEGDLVTYTIRIYNEGMKDAIVGKIMDNVPKGLVFVPGSNINQKYKWKEFDSNTNSNPNGWQSGVETDYFATTTIPKFDQTKENEAPTFDSTTGIGIEKGVSYVELKIELKAAPENTSIIKNLAEITVDNGDDVDSIPDNKNEPEDDEDFDVIKPVDQVQPEEPSYDLALKKFITGLADGNNATKKIPDSQTRDLHVTNVEALKNRGDQKTKADAEYSFGLDKNSTPVQVEQGDLVTYTIRIYNEGMTDAKVGKIIDNVPSGIVFLPDSNINQKYKWKTFNSNPNPNGWQSGVETDYFATTVIPKFDRTKENEAPTFDSSTGIGMEKGVSYVELKIEFKVTSGEENIIKNLAEITVDDGDDVDSIPDDKNESEDDEDFDVIKPKKPVQPDPPDPPYDLALKKFITGLADGNNTIKNIPDNQKRDLHVKNVDALKNRGDQKTKADAEYTFGLEKNQNPVQVEQGDIVTYTIRIYNEGLVDAKVGKLMDNVPNGLVFLPDSSINKKYKWTTFNSNPNPNGWQSGVETDYFATTVIPKFDQAKENEAPTFDSSTGIGMEKGLSYVELKIEFKVSSGNTDTIKNLAEITSDNGDDVDSTPDDKDESEDDEDYDVIVPKEQIFDLALRKFITKINDKDLEKNKTRVPVVDPSKLISGEDDTATYKHPKQEDIPIVVKDDIIIYTIRVYNEGNVDGYANEIKDDLPEGIEYLPNHEINQKYEWVMYDQSGNVTNNVSDAKEIRTRTRSEAKGVTKQYPSDYTKAAYPYFKPNTNIILAYNPSIMKDGPDYIDVQVAFKVIKDIVTDGKSVIINTAQVTEESGNDRDTDDLVDKEYLQLRYFDLSLIKYVSRYFLTIDGNTEEHKGNNGTENPEPPVKVELSKNDLSKITLKYEFTIKITNEGEIAGYAKEIKDRIPQGLEFFSEDNKKYGWKVSSDGIVTTDYLADRLLQPGESATVPIILRWINNESNFGLKVNVAEISKDENEYGVPDIDSKPNNNQDGEDDQDDAPVILSIKTGSVPIYITLVITVITILCSGFYLIYKYVVKK